MDIWKTLAKTELRKYVPMWLKELARTHFSVTNYDKERWRQSNPYSSNDPVSSYKSKYPFTLGIIEELSHYHQHFIAACRELEVSYKLLDITSTDWVEKVRNSGCDAFLVWPSAIFTIWKNMYDERLRIMVEDLGKIIYPSQKEIWIWESKRRMRDWFKAHNVPHPVTEVFFDLDHALDFINNARLPLVMKTNHGASSKGVIIMKEKNEAIKLVRRVFNEGVVLKNGDPRDRQWGSVILQEYLPEVKEWRMVRIGKSYFGHPKGRAGDFHSGSGVVLWDSPNEELLTMLRKVTDAGSFSSMCLDVFETSDGRYLANELQTVFGASYSQDQLRIDGVAGRYIYNPETDGWIFESGDFARNACANLRVEYLIETLQNVGER